MNRRGIFKVILGTATVVATAAKAPIYSEDMGLDKSPSPDADFIDRTIHGADEHPYLLNFEL